MIRRKAKASEPDSSQIAQPKNNITQTNVAINGFTRQKTAHQVILICLPSFTFTLSLLILFFSPETASLKTTFTIVYGLTFIFMAVAWFKVSSIDPTDTIHQFYLQFKKNRKFFDKSKYLTCSKCFSFIEDHSAHCQDCNRCVPMLNHHSRWVNNCIGAKNYFEFIWMIFFLGMLSGIQLSVSLFLEIREVQNQGIHACQLSMCIFCLILNLVIIIPTIFCLIEHISYLYKNPADISLICQYRKSNRIKPEITCKSLHMNFFTTREQSPTPQFFIKKVTSEHFNSESDNEKQQDFSAQLPALPALLKKKLITIEKYQFIKKYGNSILKTETKPNSKGQQKTSSIEEKAICDKIGEEKQLDI